MAKVDLSENLFDEMKRTLAEMAGDSGETAAKADRLPGRRNSGQEAARADERNAVASGTVGGGAASALFLALSEIEPDPEQPRKTFVASGAQDAIDNDLELLKESILQHGVLQPIAVHPVASGRYRIIAGERRWRASMAARDSGQPCGRKGYDLSRIPAVILEPDTDADRLEMQLVENLARADMTPVDTAKAVKQLMDSLDPKPSLADLGKRLGRSKAWVHQMLSLGSEDAQAVAEYLGVPLESIGQTDISRMKGWMKDEDKRIVLDAIRASLQAGETLSRVLVDREEDRYEQGLSGKPQEVDMQQENGAVMGSHPARAFDANGEEVDLSTIDLRSIDSDEDIEDGGAVDENGVVVGDPADGASLPGASLPGASLPNQVTVTLPRPLLERAFAKAGRELPGTMGTVEIVEVLELVLNE
ncbi:ParB/RepB/Spo0J family partition protein [Acidithiobacillus ferrooxidans]|uniref:ParB family protein n=1 Tax=Acidithiobacillus ferrooxidans (strain ATCC 23270 / DSM 14882 / CIP 104768 / NCIMB 8455) TaxID=243159 RepID=B7JB56_ACIF2|nr:MULTISPECIES: ParB/RepB/Spo0J family partition protein [Acidithiobacillus]EGQ61567.1 parB family protein [Acidithiobacillus sp. GGI-221]ACK77983.1 parB family protein [Acidithiobacillus ferrooxidans ATCC 23270]MBN6745241.1 ParB/RepB/Spo0J family partition protein [Acidithiobacillus sp. MC2.2]MBN6748091.1 ParB/RepB/Spo0J family partition protein [Acidithiobacillus sp. PG05]MCR0970358.1 ParB/RepB/Spo0J family partition protein [Acidithiobacillus ferrooxidans]